MFILLKSTKNILFIHCWGIILIYIHIIYMIVYAIKHIKEVFVLFSRSHT